MSFFKSHKQFPVGIDIGTSRVRAIQLSQGPLGLPVTSTRLEFQHAGLKDPVELTADACRTLAARWKEAGFTSREVTVAVPRSVLIIKSVRLPHMPQDELEAAARLEVAESIPFPLDEAQIRCVTAGEVRQGPEGVLEVLVLIARNEDLHRLTAAIHYAGLIPASLDVEPAALLRTVTRYPQRGLGAKAIHALLDVGACSSRMVIGQGDDIGFVKTLDVGADRLNDAVARRLDLSAEEAAHARLTPRQISSSASEADDASLNLVVRDAIRPIGEELGRLAAMCLRYHSVTFRGPRPERLLVSGANGSDAALRQCLATATGLEVVGNPAMDRALTGVPDGGGIPAGLIGPAWAAAMGLALRRFAPAKAYANASGLEVPMLATVPADGGRTVGATAGTGAAHG